MSATELLSPARAVRLRRIAGVIDERADGSKSPADARALARRMRLRAVALEAGTESDDEDLEQASALLRELEPDAAP